MLKKLDYEVKFFYNSLVLVVVLEERILKLVSWGVYCIFFFNWFILLWVRLGL